MKKKLTAAMLVVCLLAIAIAGATMAYFTDTDKAENVMVLGNVKIAQNETDRDGEDFVNNQQKIMPLVKGETYLTKDGTTTSVADGEELAIWDKTMENEIDKFVSVTNKGIEDAYVRTILAFETVRSYTEGSTTEFVDLHDHFFLVNGDFDYINEYITIDGVEYVLAVKTYDAPLASGETTPASLRQFALTYEAGNEVYDFFGEEYKILAVSQGVQTTGFGSAEEALNEAFGEVNAANAAAWFN